MKGRCAGPRLAKAYGACDPYLRRWYDRAIIEAAALASDRRTLPSPEMHSMALTNQQLWVAGKIDTRMQKLIRAGKDNMAIMAAMADHMPTFHQLLSTAQPDDMEQLTRKFPGFYRYAKILESLACGIQSGAIPVPGRKAVIARRLG